MTLKFGTERQYDNSSRETNHLIHKCAVRWRQYKRGVEFNEIYCEMKFNIEILSEGLVSNKNFIYLLGFKAKHIVAMIDFIYILPKEEL